MKQIKTYRKLSVRFVRETAAEPYPAQLLRHPGAVARLARDSIAQSTQEHFLVFHLDTSNRLIGLAAAGVGTIDSCSVHPRDVFGPAMAVHATSLVVAHNHPTGDPTPSSADRALTDRLKAAGELLGIPILDHVVIGSERYYSFAESSFYPYPLT